MRPTRPEEAPVATIVFAARLAIFGVCELRILVFTKLRLLTRGIKGQEQVVQCFDLILWQLVGLKGRLCRRMYRPTD